MVEQVAAAFGDWDGDGARSRLEVADAAPPPARRLSGIAMADKAQADVAYGFIGVRRLDPSYMAASVMNNALGQYALGGRLGDSIRERQGMAYYVFSSLDGGVGPGPLMVRAGVSAENVERTIRSIDHELLGHRVAGLHRAGDRRVEAVHGRCPAAAARDPWRDRRDSC